MKTDTEKDKEETVEEGNNKKKEEVSNRTDQGQIQDLGQGVLDFFRYKKICK